MLRLFEVPLMFQEVDILFSILSVFMVCLVSAYACKVYKLSSDRRHLYFLVALLLVVFSLLTKLFLNSILYYSSVRDVTAVLLEPISNSIPSVNLLYRLVYFTHFLLLLGAWSMIFFLSQPSRNRLDNTYEVIQLAVFASFLAMLALVATYSYPIYAITSLIILAGASINYRKQYLNHGTGTALGTAVFLLCLAHACYAIVPYTHTLYVFAECLMLCAYYTLFKIFRKVVK